MIQITLLLISTLPVMAGAIIAASLPAMANHFGGTPQAELVAKLMLTLPALLIALCGPLAGQLADRWGRLKLLGAALLLFCLAGTSGLYLVEPIHLLLGRALLGIATAGIMTASVALAADHFHGPARDVFMGRQGAAMATGGLVFVTLGGALADQHWRAPFAIYVISLLFWVLAQKALANDPPAPPPHLQYEGDGKLPPAGTLALIYFLAFLGMVMFYLVPVQLPFFLTERLQAAGWQTGLAIGFTTLFGAAGSLLYRRLKRRLGFTEVMIVSYSCTGLAYFLLQQADSYVWVLLALLPAGLGTGFMMPNFNLWLMSLAPPTHRGRLLGGLTFFVFSGQFLSPFYVKAIPESWGIYSTSSAVLALVALTLTLIGLVRGRGE